MNQIIKPDHEVTCDLYSRADPARGQLRDVSIAYFIAEWKSPKKIKTGLNKMLPKVLLEKL